MFRIWKFHISWWDMKHLKVRMRHPVYDRYPYKRTVGHAVCKPSGALLKLMGPDARIQGIVGGSRLRPATNGCILPPFLATNVFSCGWYPWFVNCWAPETLIYDPTSLFISTYSIALRSEIQPLDLSDCHDTASKKEEFHWVSDNTHNCPREKYWIRFSIIGSPMSRTRLKINPSSWRHP